MTVERTKGFERLSDCAYQAIQKHFKKSVKHEKDVLTDTDPEALHQMRVGMRRLRTALQVFEPVLNLPKAVNANQIKKLAHRLGTVRDLDVMQSKLESRYRPDLDGKEQKQIDRVLKYLHQQRRQDFDQMEQMLKGKRYDRFKQGFSDWLAEAQYEPIATLSIRLTLPDLLLPLVSRLLLHPGWLVGTQEGAVAENPRSEMIQGWLDRQSEPLHDLRKQMKQVRYQTEFFTDFYGKDYRSQMDDFQNIQEVLGQIQDYSVLKAFLASALTDDWQKELPTLSQRLEHEQISLWKTWQPIQRRYLAADFRDRLRQIVLNPCVPEETPVQTAASTARSALHPAP